MPYNLKNISNMSPHNRELHVDKLRRWAYSTLETNLISSFHRTDAEWYRMGEAWHETLTVHYTIYENAIIDRGIKTFRLNLRFIDKTKWIV